MHLCMHVCMCPGQLTSLPPSSPTATFGRAWDTPPPWLGSPPPPLPCRPPSRAWAGHPCSPAFTQTASMQPLRLQLRVPPSSRCAGHSGAPRCAQP
eukprot:365990-Chlamydomonas_euryale.AAC.8